MTTDAAFILVYSTFPSLEAAEAAGAALVDARLAACVNIIPGLVSIYKWHNERQRGEEVLMLVKTRAALGARVTAEIERLSPYDTPAVSVLPIVSGAPGFLAWLADETSDLASSD